MDDNQWIWIAGVGLFALIGALTTAKAVLEKIAQRKGPENTKADEWAGYLSIGTGALRAIAAALGVEVKSEDTDKDVAKKIDAKVKKP